MTHHGTESSQLASLRIQTKGYRLIVAIPTDQAIGHLTMSVQADAPGLKLNSLSAFLTKMQPQDVAEFLKHRPGSIFHALVPPSTVSYIPPAWLVCEKVVNYKCVFGIRAAFVPLQGAVEHVKHISELVKVTENTNKDAKDLIVMKQALLLLQESIDGAGRMLLDGDAPDRAGDSAEVAGEKDAARGASFPEAASDVPVLGGSVTPIAPPSSPPSASEGEHAVIPEVNLDDL